MSGNSAPLSRRRFLGMAGMAAAAVPAAGALAACSPSSGGGASAVNRPVKIGYVSPQTGSLSAYADAENYVIGTMREFFAKGIVVGTQTHPVQIVVRDSQSDQGRAAQAASDLIFSDGVDLMLVASTAETTNPVSDQCEANGVPCISTVAPWQSWYGGRGGSTANPYKWTYHFFWGLEDVTATYAAMWAQAQANGKVTGLWPDDVDGNGFASTTSGFPPAIARAGDQLVSTTRFQPGDTSWMDAAIAKLKTEDVQILTGVPEAADFLHFWQKANKAGYKPKVVTLSRALLFPTDVEAIGPTALNLSTEVWWSPSHPYKSSLDNSTPADLSNNYSKATSRQWVQTLGFVHSMFEIAASALADVTSLDDKAKIADAIGQVNLNSIVGPIAFGKSPGTPKNVAKTSLVGGQWRQGDSTHPYQLVIVNNVTAPNIDVTPGGLAPLV